MCDSNGCGNGDLRAVSLNGTVLSLIPTPWNWVNQPRATAVRGITVYLTDYQNQRVWRTWGQQGATSWVYAGGGTASFLDGPAGYGMVS